MSKFNGGYRDKTCWLPLAIALTTPIATVCQVQAAQISGTVTLQDSGQHASGARVFIKETLFKTKTDSNGQFQLPELPAGVYELVIESSLGKTFEQKLTLREDDQKQLTISLEPKPIERITIMGQRDSLSRSLSRQREADNIVTVASADGIGEFPDSNASESLQRLPGLSIERDQGEGRYVRVRGLAPDLNAVTYNGSRLTSPDAGGRAIGLDVVPSDLLESIEVTKSLTPDMDADSLGGAIEIKSLSAFDKDGRFAKLSAEGSYDDNTSQWSPKLAGTYSDIFELGGDAGELGVAVSGSWFNRKFGSENVETGGAWDLDDEQARLEEVEMRDYQIERDRLGLAANFDWQPSDLNSVYLRTLYSRFADEEERNALVTEFDEPVLPGQNDTATEHARELKARKETQKMYAIVLGSEHILDQWTVALQGGWSYAKTDRPDAIAGAAFELEMDDSVSFSDTRKPVVSGDELLYDATAYELDEIEAESTYATDEEYNARIDISRTYDLDDIFLTFKFGGKLSRRTKENEETHWVFEEFQDQPDTLDFYATPVDYSLGRYGPGIGKGSIDNLLGQLDRDSAEDELESRINDHSIDEDINAGYLMVTSDWGALRAVAGVRYESTDLDTHGWLYSELDDEYLARNVSNSYSDWFPSAQLRYELNDKTILRAAWTQSMVRPTFEQLSPGYLIEGDDDEIEASFGNPELSPLSANNFDLSAEYYDEDIGVLSLGLFYKDIEHFIYQADLAGTGDYLDYDEAVTYVNGNDATLYGAEINFVHQFNELPEPWNGLLVSSNVTFSHSEADIAWFDDGVEITREVPFPSQSDVTGNLALGYENPWMSLRLSAAYKSEYLQEVSELDDENYDTYQDDHLQVDFIAKGHINKKMMVYFKALNINDEPFYTYSGNTSRNAQYEEYGRTYQLGVSYIGF